MRLRYTPESLAELDEILTGIAAAETFPNRGQFGSGLIVAENMVSRTILHDQNPPNFRSP